MQRLLPVVLILLGAVLFSCAAPEPFDDPQDDPRDGVYLYRKHCSRCHGVLTRTAKPGRRPARILSAIKQNVGGMGSLRALQEEDIVMIADALVMVQPSDDATGEELYAMYCGDCHRPVESSDISGSDYPAIKAAMGDVMCNTVNLQFLDNDDLSKIAWALAKPIEPVEAPEELDAGFEVERFMTCEGVSDREPVNPSAEFGPGTERVYAFLEARDIERNMYVFFVWYLDGVEAGRDRIKLGKGTRWRTYCYKTIDGGRGDWRVELRGPEDEDMSSLDFSVARTPAR